MTSNVFNLRRVKMPKGYPHAGMWCRIVTTTETTVDLHVFRECRSTMRGPISYVVTVALEDFAGAF